jgi:hypothetical protein
MRRSVRPTAILSLLVTLVAVGLSMAPATASAYQPVGPDIRISGSDRYSQDAEVASNPIANEYLVVWARSGLNDAKTEIVGQRLDGSGNKLGKNFQISNVAESNASHAASLPRVAYNPIANNYLVVWQAGSLVSNEEFEILGQLVSRQGGEIGADFRISNAGLDGDPEHTATAPDITFNQTANEFLVAWQDHRLGEYEIFGQLISAAGAEVGADFRISHVGMEGDQAVGANAPAIAANPADNEYLVTWVAGERPDFVSHVFGQRVSAAGANVGSEFPVSNASERPASPDIAYNTNAGGYLAAWEAPGAASLAPNAIVGRILSASGVGAGGVIQISNLVNRGVFDASIAYNGNANEYFVTWSGRGPAYQYDIEVFGQRLSPTGAEVDGDCLVSKAYKAEDPQGRAVDPSPVYNQTADEYFVAWDGDEDAGVDEQVIFGRRLANRAASCSFTQITHAPKKKVKTRKRKVRAVFAFTSTRPNSTFECKLDNGAFEPCTSPEKFKVKKGKHTFAVRATDAVGNVDASPATFDWKVKRKRKRHKRH